MKEIKHCLYLNWFIIDKIYDYHRLAVLKDKEQEIKIKNKSIYLKSI